MDAFTTERLDAKDGTAYVVLSWLWLTICNRRKTPVNSLMSMKPSMMSTTPSSFTEIRSSTWEIFSKFVPATSSGWRMLQRQWVRGTWAQQYARRRLPCVKVVRHEPSGIIDFQRQRQGARTHKASRFHQNWRLALSLSVWNSTRIAKWRLVSSRTKLISISPEDVRNFSLPSLNFFQAVIWKRKGVY